MAGAALTGVLLTPGGTLDLYVDASGWATGASGAYVGCQLTLWLGSTPVQQVVESNVFSGSTRSPYMKFTLAHRFVSDSWVVVGTSMTLYAQTGTCILRDAKVWGTVR